MKKCFSNVDGSKIELTAGFLAEVIDKIDSPKMQQLIPDSFKEISNNIFE